LLKSSSLETSLSEDFFDWRILCPEFFLPDSFVARKIIHFSIMRANAGDELYVAKIYPFSQKRFRVKNYSAKNYPGEEICG
jgi:hypothetical protein